MGFQGDKKYQDNLEIACKVKMKELSHYAHYPSPCSHHLNKPAWVGVVKKLRAADHDVVWAGDWQEDPGDGGLGLV